MARQSELTRHTMDNFRRIVQALRTSHRAAENLDLTGAQLFVLSVLQDADGPLSVGDIARETQTDPSTASVVVSRLVERAYIRRTRSSDDSRRVDLSLTARGRAVQRAHPQSTPQRQLASALARLSPRDAKAFDDILDRIVEEMGLQTEPAPMMFDDSDEPVRKRRRAARA